MGPADIAKKVIVAGPDTEHWLGVSLRSLTDRAGPSEQSERLASMSIITGILCLIMARPSSSRPVSENHCYRTHEPRRAAAAFDRVRNRSQQDDQTCPRRVGITASSFDRPRLVVIAIMTKGR